MAKTLAKKLFNSYKDKCRGIDIIGNSVYLKEDAETYFLNIYTDGTREVVCRYREGDVECNAVKRLDLNPPKDDPGVNGLCPYMIKH